MKHIIFKSIAALTLLLVIEGCKPSYYVANDFQTKTTRHKKVAVIPVEMLMTGTKPKKMTEAQIDSMEVEESKQFQLSLFNNLLKYSNTSQGTVMIEFQSYDRTNKLLADSGFTIRSAWEADPVVLAKKLGVDAVVKTRVVKERYMSDLASYGIQTATTILSNTLGGLGGMYGGNPIRQATRNGRTNDIDAQCTLLNGEDGSVLWKDMHKGAADWNSPANQIIERITVKFARNFPYRKKS